MLPLQARVDPGAMAIKGYSTFPKLRHYWTLTMILFSVISRTLVGRRSYPSAEKQSVYSTAPAHWASHIENTHWEEVLPFSRETVGVFYSPSRMSWPALVTTQIISTEITYHNSHYFNKIMKVYLHKNIFILYKMCYDCTTIINSFFSKSIVSREFPSCYG